MGEALGAMLALGGTLLFIVGLIALFKPIPKLWLATRRAAVLCIVLSIVSCGAGGALLPPPPNRPAAKAEGEKERAQAGKEAAAERRASAKAEEAATREAVRTEVRALWRDVLAAVGPCDRANSALADELQDMQRGRASIYRAYELASRGEDICRDTWSRLGDLDAPPAAERALRRSFEDTLESCRNAYLSRQMSLGRAKTVFDGDLRPSAVESYREAAEAGQAGVLACVAGFISHGATAGVPPEELTRMTGAGGSGSDR